MNTGRTMVVMWALVAATLLAGCTDTPDALVEVGEGIARQERSQCRDHPAQERIADQSRPGRSPLPPRQEPAGSRRCRVGRKGAPQGARAQVSRRPGGAAAGTRADRAGRGQEGGRAVRQGRARRAGESRRTRRRARAGAIGDGQHRRRAVRIRRGAEGGPRICAGDAGRGQAQGWRRRPAGGHGGRGDSAGQVRRTTSTPGC